MMHLTRADTGTSRVAGTGSMVVPLTTTLPAGSWRVPLDVDRVVAARRRAMDRLTGASDCPDRQIAELIAGKGCRVGPYRGLEPARRGSTHIGGHHTRRLAQQAGGHSAYHRHQDLVALALDQLGGCGQLVHHRQLVSAYDLTCRTPYDLICRSSSAS